MMMMILIMKEGDGGKSDITINDDDQMILFFYNQPQKIAHVCTTTTQKRLHHYITSWVTKIVTLNQLGTPFQKLVTSPTTSNVPNVLIIDNNSGDMLDEVSWQLYQSEDMNV